jgi:hypothetical protein
MKPFKATHKIDGNVEVMAVEGDDGGLILYTEAEWTAIDNADWVYYEADGLTFQGRNVGAGLQKKGESK